MENLAFEILDNEISRVERNIDRNKYELGELVIEIFKFDEFHICSSADIAKHYDNLKRLPMLVNHIDSCEAQYEVLSNAKTRLIAKLEKENEETTV